MTLLRGTQSEIKRWLGKIFVKAENLAQDARRRALLERLRSCGKNVSVRDPIALEVPELISIGDNVSIASFVHIWGNGGVTIGPRTMIASHVAITSATHEPSSLEMWKSLVVAPVVIEEDVWIGAHAVIFPGVTIGRGAVVGAGSVVRSDVPPFGVVAGVPATVIRMRPLGDQNFKPGVGSRWAS
jgi:maltose O-acetyltransferase